MSKPEASRAVTEAKTSTVQEEAISYEPMTNQELRKAKGRVKGHFVCNNNFRKNIRDQILSTASARRFILEKVIEKFEVEDCPAHLRWRGHAALNRLIEVLTFKTKPAEQTEEIRRFLEETGSNSSALLITRVHRILKCLKRSSILATPSRVRLEEIGVKQKDCKLALRIIKNLSSYPEMKRYLKEPKRAQESTDLAISRAFQTISDDSELFLLVQDILRFRLFGNSAKLGSAAGINCLVPKTVWRFMHRQKRSQDKRMLSCGSDCDNDHQEMMFNLIIREITRDPPRTLGLSEQEVAVGMPQKRVGGDISQMPRKQEKRNDLNHSKAFLNGYNGVNVQLLRLFSVPLSPIPEIALDINLSSAVQSVTGWIKAMFTHYLVELLANRKTERSHTAQEDLESEQERTSFDSDSTKECIKEMYETVRYQSGSTNYSEVDQTEISNLEEHCPADRQVSGLETVTEEEQAYGRVIETNQEACEKLCLCLGPYSQGEALLQVCYRACREFFMHPLSALKEVLATCSICENPDTIILAWDLFRTIHGINFVDSELYLHMLEMAGRQGKSWALLWPLWKYSRLKDIYMNVLFLLIGHATVERKCEEIAQWLNQYLTVCNKDYSKHMQSLARKVVQALSDFIDTPPLLSFQPRSPYYFPSDPIQAIIEKVWQAVTQIERNTVNQRAVELENTAKMLGLVYKDTGYQPSLLKDLLKYAASKAAADTYLCLEQLIRIRLR